MGKETEYLLKTQSFPHSPQVFPQEFSTAAGGCGYSVLIYIKRSDSFRPISHFFAGCGFYHSESFVQKFGLDKGECGKRRVKFLEICQSCRSKQHMQCYRAFPHIAMFKCGSDFEITPRSTLHTPFYLRKILKKCRCYNDV